MFNIEVFFYEKHPQFCANCKVIGHGIHQCHKIRSKVMGESKDDKLKQVPVQGMVISKDKLALLAKDTMIGSDKQVEDFRTSNVVRNKLSSNRVIFNILEAMRNKF